MRQVLAWAMGHDMAMALRLAGALRWWWFLRGRLAGEYPLLREAAGRAEPGSDGWCAAQFCLGWTAAFSADLAGSLGHFTALRDAVADRPPCPALVDALVGRSNALRELRQIPEATDDARRALAVAREIGYAAGELLALVGLSGAADFAGDYDDAVRLARQAAQITSGVPGVLARVCSYLLTGVLIDAGDLAAAERVSAAGLARARDVGDLWNQGALLPRIVDLDLRTGRVDDATAHLREGLQIAVRTGTWADLLDGLSHCGTLCAATGRHADALTMWAASEALAGHEGFTDPPWFDPRQEEPLREARRVLGPDGARAAEERGGAMSWDTAAEYALILTAPGPPAMAPELEKLSARERELVTLVAQGHTNAQIAAHLSISVRTVRSHLDQIRNKAGSRRRADLTRLALQVGLV